MNEKKSEIGKQKFLNPQETLNSKDMKKVLRKLFSYEHFVDLNVKFVHQEEKNIQLEG